MLHRASVAGTIQQNAAVARLVWATGLVRSPSIFTLQPSVAARTTSRCQLKITWNVQKKGPWVSMDNIMECQTTIEKYPPENWLLLYLLLLLLWYWYDWYVVTPCTQATKYCQEPAVVVCLPSPKFFISILYWAWVLLRQQNMDTHWNSRSRWKVNVWLNVMLRHMR